MILPLDTQLLLADDLSPNQAWILVDYIQDIQHAADIPAAIQARPPTFAILNPVRIASLFHLQLAAAKAWLHQQRGTMRTRSLPTELLYCLSPSTNIGDAFRTYGFDADHCSTGLLCVRFLDHLPTGEDSFLQEWQRWIQGTVGVCPLPAMSHDRALLSSMAIKGI